jgi:membrane protease YdiL (CAAX protease family)
VANHSIEPGRSGRAVPLVVGSYAIVAAVGLGIAALRGEPNVFVCASYRLGDGAVSGHLASLAGGVVLAITIIAATRYLVRTTAWARALHEDLRPMARALGTGAIVPVALASSIGEEVLFRGALVPWLGVVVSSVLFGALHQMRGRSRLSWVAFAVVVGLMFGGLFRATGSLLGPIVAHALINGANLRFLITHAPPNGGGRGSMGGLLRR